MVETKELIGYILLFVLSGMMIGIGVLTFDKFADASAEETKIINESFTYPGLNASVTLAHGNSTSPILTFYAIVNSTGNVLPATNYSITEDAGNITALSNTTTCKTGMTCKATYSYDEFATETRSVMNNNISSITPIASDWMGLIVTVLILAIIITMVVRSFGKVR